MQSIYSLSDYVQDEAERLSRASINTGERRSVKELAMLFGGNKNESLSKPKTMSRHNASESKIGRKSLADAFKESMAKLKDENEKKLKDAREGSVSGVSTDSIKERKVNIFNKERAVEAKDRMVETSINDEKSDQNSSSNNIFKSRRQDSSSKKIDIQAIDF
jgi:hypothetical protein